MYGLTSNSFNFKTKAENWIHYCAIKFSKNKSTRVRKIIQKIRLLVKEENYRNLVN